MVIDEYGASRDSHGRDILEEIVGEIEDEDTEEEESLKLSKAKTKLLRHYRSTEIGKIERLFDMEIEDDDLRPSPD